MHKIGVIGGSGLHDPKWSQDFEELTVKTAFGEPSSPVTACTIEGVEVALLARHGRHHQIPPSQVNYRANIAALQEVGCTHVLATTACGSLRAEIHKGDFIVLDQFIDFTKQRKMTFFESFAGGAENAKHTPMADPFDEGLREKIIASARDLGLSMHETGTVITIEGPRFSTRAESRMFQAWGADVINMSVATEVALANEAEIPYAAVAMSTDYDCWKTDEPPVNWEEITTVFAQNVENAEKLLRSTIARLDQE